MYLKKSVIHTITCANQRNGRNFYISKQFDDNISVIDRDRTILT